MNPDLESKLTMPISSLRSATNGSPQPNQRIYTENTITETKTNNEKSTNLSTLKTAVNSANHLEGMHTVASRPSTQGR